MILIYESWKKILSNPFFYFISIALGLVFTIVFSFFNPGTATSVSVMVLFSIIFISLLIAFILKDKQDIIETARKIDKNGRHKYALKILMNARKKARNNEYQLALKGIYERTTQSKTMG